MFIKYRVSQNSTHKLREDLDDTVRNHNQVGRYDRQVQVPHYRLQMSAVNMNRFTNANSADVHFAHCLANGNGHPIASGKISNEARTKSPNVPTRAPEPVWT
ncbi:hypothetical protein AVEN_233572-1 [Araneus ventricosus]|uniref:Uncharacterized protein n=1 Tax=Araneus ventricosus TaxID=182803 RepID=A0A4Y2HPT6_ARAVE|nr:hypothetical protein AVEN_233572-1 [Araneus ventricosus]